MAPWALQFSETRELELALAVLLFDRFTGENALLGTTEVRVSGQAVTPFVRPGEATYLFFGLPPGAYTFEVLSHADTPYYLPVSIPLVLPMPSPLWPAFPDQTLADPSKQLSDPTQTPAYRAQRQLATLQPAVAYPFPGGATLVRGTVFAGGLPLAGARVRRLGDTLEYTTGNTGEFVLFFPRIQGTGETVTLRSSHPAHPDVDVLVNVRRGMTVLTTIIAP